MRDEVKSRKLYTGGRILTMEDENPFVQALLTVGDRILALGTEEEVRSAAGNADDLEIVDLGGATLMPAFIDSHSHFSGCATGMLQIQLQQAKCLSDVADSIAAYIAENRIPPGQWVQAVGYDQNRLAERRHPDRWLLDQAAPLNPVVAVHQSNHMGVFNSQALESLGITEDTPCPDGGYRQLKDGQLSGYMEENAFLIPQRQLPMPSMDVLMGAYEKAQQWYASCGITTVQEGMLPDALLPLYHKLIGEKRLWLDVVGFADGKDGSNIAEQLREHKNRYLNHFKLGGYKIFLDGSPQGRTAWLRQPYLPEETSKQQADEASPAQLEYCGYGILTDSQVEELAVKAGRDGMQLLAHCNGDRAAVQFIDVIEQVQRKGWEEEREDRGRRRWECVRPVMIHAQMLPVDQMKRVKALGIIPSFFLAHIWHWGDIHVKNLGERAFAISPAASALKAGVPFTFHQDSPVIAPDMLETVWCAVERKTQSGICLGKEERISAWEALKAVTINAAYQYFEESQKGSLKPGKKADLIWLSADPTQVEAEQIREIQVLKTIKDGEVVYEHPVK